MISTDSFRRCLKDEKKAAALDSCLTSLDKTNEATNDALRKLAILEKYSVELKAFNDLLQKKNEEQKKELDKPGFWWGLAIGGGVVGFLFSGVALFYSFSK